MSKFQLQLDSFKKNIEELKQVEEEPIEEDLATSNSPVKKEETKVSSHAAIAKIQEQAREKASKEQEEASKTDSILNNFKRFLTQEKRTKFISACESQDTGKLGYIPFMAFSRCLKGMGFRLLFDQVKLLLQILNVYDENRDRVYYYKAVGSAFRKLYLKNPYNPPRKLTQSDAIIKIQRLFRLMKEKRLNKFLERKAGKNESEYKAIDPKIIIQGIAHKIASSQKTLLQSFNEIDKDGSGFIEIAELKDLLFEFGLNLTLNEIGGVFNILDENKTGKITFRTLSRVIRDSNPNLPDVLSSITVTEEEKELTTSEILSGIQKAISESDYTVESVFKLFDTKNEGKINFEAFYSIVNKICPDYTQFYVRQVFNHIDQSHDGFIEYEEFSSIFFKKQETPAEMLRRKEQEQEKSKKEMQRKAERENSQKESLSSRIFEENKPEEVKSPKFSLAGIIDNKVDLDLSKKFSEHRQEEIKSPKFSLTGLVHEQSQSKPNTARDKITINPAEIKPEAKAEELKTVKPEFKPSLREEIAIKQKQIEDEERKKVLEKLEAERDPFKKQIDERRIKEKEIYDAKIKKEEEEKKKSMSLMNTLLGKTSNQSVKGTARASLNRSKKPVPVKPKPSLQEKAGKLVNKPQESQIVLKAQSKELQEMVKNEFLMPIVNNSVNHGESLKLARSVQKQFEKRAIIKHVYV